MENTVFPRRFLTNLKLVLGMKVNHEKCCLHGVKVDENSMGSLANILDCRQREISFNYLRVMVGSVHRKALEWEYVVQKIRKRLKR